MMNTPTSRTSLMIEGNIGAGKSTFLRILSEQLNIQPVFEPDKKWQEVGGDNLLEKFYTDTSRWAYTFQTYAFVSRVVAQESSDKQTNSHIPHVVERSVFADRYCFARNCYEMGVMSGLEWNLYREWFGWLVESYTTKPAGFIYLRVSPEICHERIIKRSRTGEDVISLDYLQRLHDKHEDWLIHNLDVAPYISNVPVLTLDVTQDFEHDVREQQKHLNTIVAFFGHLGVSRKGDLPLHQRHEKVEIL